MSKIENLIKELCPKGVPMAKFSDCASFTRGITYNKKQEALSGDVASYKLFRANNITLESNCLNFDDVKSVITEVRVKDEQWLKKDDILICAGSGSKEHVGKVAYIREDMDYTFGGFMAVIRAKEGIESRYLFHSLIGTTFKDYLKVALNSTTINNLNNQVMSGYEIPLPPLDVQKEIVRILDKFSAMVEILDQEIELRQKQYEYYREKLLSPPTPEGGEWEWKKLGEVAVIGTGSRNTQDGLEEGLYPFYTRGQEILRMNEYDYDETAILTAGDGAGVGKTFHYVVGKYALHQRAYRFVPNQEMVKPKFLYNYIKQTFYDYIMRNSVFGSVPSVRKPMLEKYIVPVPPLDRQQEIVDTLDKFEAMIGNLKEERALRQKQYEYYREKLLTFYLL